MPRPPQSPTTLSELASRLGGEAYAGGARALIPAPGHRSADRSVSLRLVEGRLLVHSFGSGDWREVLDDLRARGWIDAGNRLIAGASGPPPGAPASEATAAERVAVAQRLWAAGGPIRAEAPAGLYGARRGVGMGELASEALRAHAAVASSVYRDHGPRRAALLAAVRDAEGAICAVEITYLDALGRRSATARPPRKVVGILPPGCAVRLTEAGVDLLVGEGVFTTLSAMRRFGLPGWALLSTSNLRRWTPPPDVRRVLIAGDRGPDGERSARALRTALRARGVSARVALPPVGCGDWNDLDQEEAKEGRVGAPGSQGNGP